jgi:hypothetical protein
MTCHIARAPGAVFAVWGTPEVQDAERVLLELHAAVHEAGGPVVYITRVPVDAPPPAPLVKQRIRTLMPEVLAQCSSYHVVLEGSGFVAAFKRGVLLSLLQPFWRKRVFFVHANCADVPGTLSPKDRQCARAVLEKADTLGYLQARPPQL